MQKGPVNVYAFIGKLSSLLPENKITVVGNGSACVVGSHGYEIKKGRDLSQTQLWHQWDMICRLQLARVLLPESRI